MLLLTVTHIHHLGVPLEFLHVCWETTRNCSSQLRLGKHAHLKPSELPCYLVFFCYPFGSVNRSRQNLLMDVALFEAPWLCLEPVGLIF